jgi:tetratricopeptide (TPR) repeat protein
MDARALSELGWAAFKAGDYDRALSANRDSVKAATEPRVKAASLYNLGRVAEACGDKPAAVGYYLQSIRLRPNDAVAARLKALGKSEQPPWRPEPHSPCHGKSDPKSLRGCLVAEHEPF